MKFHIPELKFPNTLLTIWWGAAMMAAFTIFWLQPVNANENPYTMKQLPERYLIFAIIASYFIAVQIYILRLASFEKINTSSLIKKWHSVMTKARFLYLSLIPLLLLLPMIYYQYPVSSILDDNWVEMLIAPSTYSVAGQYPDANYLVIYVACGIIIAYLHALILGSWLSLVGLIFRVPTIALMTFVVFCGVLTINQWASSFIEPEIFRDWERLCEYRQEDDVCGNYWNYRNINRIVESLEYSIYGTLSGGIQFINELKWPVSYYNSEQVIEWEFIRNLIAGIFSPSLQLFFITRYLKKRSFEKAKRGYAA